MIKSELISYLESKQAEFTTPIFEVSYPDHAMSHDDTMTEKIPGLFSTKQVKIGSMHPTFKSQGEDFNNHPFYSTPSAKSKYKDEKEKKEKEKKPVKESGKTDISNLHFLPGYGYPTVQYDESSIRKLDTKTLDDDITSTDKWNGTDLKALSRILNSKPVETWNKTKLKPFYVDQENIRSDHDEVDDAYLYDEVNANYGKSTFGFLTKFYRTDHDGDEIKNKNGHVWIPIIPLNPVTTQEPLAMYFTKLVNNYYVVAAAVKEDQVVLMKIGTETFNFLRA